MLNFITSRVQSSIQKGFYPGAVVLVGHRGKVIYRGVFGHQMIQPQLIPMRLDTIFDLASLTKVIVTTTAVMQLLEQGKLELDAPVVKYWPEFGQNGKASVTIRQLMTHTSGFQAILPAWNPPANPSLRYQAGLKEVEQLRLINPPGEVFTYSDISFISLGHIVELVSGERIDQYANSIFLIL